jgi:hypothetical protein
VPLRPVLACHSSFHGQTGVAPKAIELDPLLGFTCAAA